MPSEMSTHEQAIPLYSLKLFEKKIGLELVFYPDFKPLPSFLGHLAMGKLVLVRRKARIGRDPCQVSSILRLSEKERDQK